MAEVNPENEGERYLNLLGLGGLANVPVTFNGVDYRGRDFLQICGQHARPALLAFEQMSTDHPNYPAARAGLVAMVSNFVKVSPEAS